MGILTWIIVGAVSGWLAGKFTQGSGFGLFGNIIMGVVGALVGGWVAGAVFHIENAITGFNLKTILVSFLGAVLVIFVAKLVKK